LDASAEESSVIVNAGEKIDEDGYFVRERVSARRYLKTVEVNVS
jgi:hypothetical protein